MAIKCTIEGVGLLDQGVCNYDVHYIDTNNLSVDGLAVVTTGFLHSLQDPWIVVRPCEDVTWTQVREC